MNYTLAFVFAAALAAQPVGQQITILSGSATDQYVVGTTGTPPGTACPAQSAPPCTWTFTTPNLPAAFPTMRWSETTIHYRIPVPIGLYIGELDFVEPSQVAAGERTLSVTINNGPASDPIDVFALAGGENILYRYLFFAPADVGIVDVVVRAITGTYAILSGIQILTQEAGITCQQPPGTPYDFQPDACYPHLRIWYLAGGPYMLQRASGLIN